MVLVGLRMSTRFPIQKSAPPSCFPPHWPRDAKIEPKHLPTIHEEGNWERFLTDFIAQQSTRFLLTALLLICDYLGLFAPPSCGSGRLFSKRSRSATRFCQPGKGLLAAFYLGFGVVINGFLNASLVSQVAAGDVHSGRRVIRGSATAFPLVQVG